MSALLYLDDLALADEARPFASDNFDNAQGELFAVNDYTLSLVNAPFLQRSKGYNSSGALEFGSFSTYNTSFFQVSVDIVSAKKVSFKLKMEENCGIFSFYDNNAELCSSGSNQSTDWTEYSFLLMPGTHLLEWNLIKSYRALPFVQNTTVNGGSWAVQFGAIGHGQESYFELVCYLAASTTLRSHRLCKASRVTVRNKYPFRCCGNQGRAGVPGGYPEI